MLALLSLLLTLAQAPAPAADAPPLPIVGTTANGGRVFRVGLGLRLLRRALSRGPPLRLLGLLQLAQSPAEPDRQRGHHGHNDYKFLHDDLP